MYVVIGMLGILLAFSFLVLLIMSIFLKQLPRKKLVIGLVSGVALFFTGVFLTPTDIDNSNTETNSTTQTTTPSENKVGEKEDNSELIEKIENNISSTLKGENYGVAIAGTDSGLAVSASLEREDGSYSEKIWVAIDAIGVVNSIKEYQPDLDKEVSTYAFDFYAAGNKKYFTEIDNSEITGEITSVKIVSTEDSSETVLTQEDIKAYQDQKKAEEEAKLQAEEEARKQAEAQKYETGLTYEDLARNPQQHKNEYVKFEGKVLQVMKNDTVTQYRLAVNSNYDQVVLIEILNAQLVDGNILEDDYIYIKGQFVDEITYTTVMGAERAIPAIIVDEFSF